MSIYTKCSTLLKNVIKIFLFNTFLHVIFSLSGVLKLIEISTVFILIEFFLISISSMALMYIAVSENKKYYRGR